MPFQHTKNISFYTYCGNQELPKMMTKTIVRITTILVTMLVACQPKHQNLSEAVDKSKVSQEKLQEVYEEVKTPYKYGIVFQHPDSTKKVDSPTIFRLNDRWFMSYIVFDGVGYETWLAASDDLLSWEATGRVMSFTENTWDAHQKAGYVSLIDIEWEGSYAPQKYNDKYWISYLGGPTSGYEAGTLSIGLAYTPDLSKAQEWTRLEQPVLKPTDLDVRWFETKTIYKSMVIHDTANHTGHPFLMYYNAKGDTANYESIGMAVSDDMTDWKRYGENPVVTYQKPGAISGDAQIARIGDVYVMFYFKAFHDEKNNAVESFACSYDLIHWTPWHGENLIEPSTPFDQQYAHKPWVIKWNGVVFHFYNAVGTEGRVIALATSKKLD